MGRVAFAWPAMEAFFDEDERIVGHTADIHHRINIRQSSRHLVVGQGDEIIAETSRPMVLSEVGRISNFISFEPDVVSVQLDGVQLRLEPGQTVIPHGPDRELDVDEVLRPANT